MRENKTRRGSEPLWALACLAMMLVPACWNVEPMENQPVPSGSWIPGKADAVNFNPGEMAGRLLVHRASGIEGYESLDFMKETEDDFILYDKEINPVCSGNVEQFLTLKVGEYFLVINDTTQLIPIQPRQDTIIHLGRIDVYNEDGESYAIAPSDGWFSDIHPLADSSLSEQMVLSSDQSVDVVAGTYEVRPEQSVDQADSKPVQVSAGMPTLMDFQSRYTSLMVHRSNEYRWLTSGQQAVEPYGGTAQYRISPIWYHLIKNESHHLSSLMEQPQMIEANTPYKIVVNDTWMEIRPEPRVPVQVFVGEIVVFNAKNKGTFQITPTKGCFTEGHELLLDTRFHFGQVIHALPGSYSIEFLDSQGSVVDTRRFQLTNKNSSAPIGSCSVCSQSHDDDYHDCRPC